MVHVTDFSISHVSAPNCTFRNGPRPQGSTCVIPLTRVTGLRINLLPQPGKLKLVGKTFFPPCSPSRPVTSLWQERMLPTPWEEQRWDRRAASQQHWGLGPAQLFSVAWLFDPVSPSSFYFILLVPYLLYFIELIWIETLSLVTKKVSFTLYIKIGVNKGAVRAYGWVGAPSPG